MVLKIASDSCLNSDNKMSSKPHANHPFLKHKSNNHISLLG